MATIGDMLRLDESGRLTTSGRGLTAKEVLNPSGRVQEPEEQAGQGFPEKAKASSQEEEHLVARDQNGMYLGLYTAKEALERWAGTKVSGKLISVVSYVSFKSAARMTTLGNLRETSYPPRIRKSIEKARRYTSVMDVREPDFWDTRQDVTYGVLHLADEPVCAIPYSCLDAAFGDAWIVIGSGLVQLVCDWDASEVAERARRATESAKAIYREIARPGERSARRAVTAPRVFKFGASHSGGALEGSSVVVLRDARRERQAGRKPVIRPADGPRERDDCKVVRDANGILLGVMTLGEARRSWPCAKEDHAVISVPSHLPLSRSSKEVVIPRDPDMAGMHDRLRTSASLAAAYTRGLGSAGARKVWEARKDVRLSVFNEGREPVSRLSPSELDSAFGCGWFRLSSVEAQLVTDLSRKEIEARCRQIERGRYARSSADSGRADPARLANKAHAQSENAGQPKTQEAPNAAGSGPVPLVVRLADGTVAYNCARELSEKMRAYLESSLPRGSWSVDARPSETVMTVDLRRAGLMSGQQLRGHCHDIARGLRHDERKAGRRDDAPLAGRQSQAAQAALGEPDSSRGRHSPAGAVTSSAASQGQPRHLRQPTSFDGPEHVLHVFKGTLSCAERGHRLGAATGILARLDGRPVEINVNYCEDCRMYFLGQREYERYRERFGPILGNFSFPYAVRGEIDGRSALSQESPLMACGYTVREEDGLSRGERQLILANMIDRGILSKPQIMEYLHFFIRWRRNNPSMRNACAKWEDDLDFVRSYQMDRQRRFVVSGVRRHR